MASAVSQDDVIAVYRSVLGRDPESSAIIQQFVDQGIDLEAMIAQALRSEEYREKQQPDAYLVKHPPPSIPSLIRPSLKPKGEHRVAVLVRSHVVDEKFDHLWRDLSGEGRRFDVYPLLNQAMLGVEAKQIEARYPGVIWNHPDQFPALGLNQKPEIYDTLWLCGDFPLYVSAMQYPDYDYYILIEYDVHFTKNATDYINRLCDRLLLSGVDVMDGVGLDFKPEPTLAESRTDWPFFGAAARAFPYVYHFYFPFLVCSRRAVTQVFAQRQLEAARQTAGDQVVICEAFVPSSLMAGGLRCADLNTALPGSYEMESMNLQRQTPEQLAGQPLDFAIRHPAPRVEMVHGVYSQRQFLERNLGLRSGSRAELEWFSTEVVQTFGASLDADLLDGFLSRARDRMAAFETA